MSEQPDPAAEPADRVLVITRLFAASPGRVFDAWTRPEQVVRWWGPRGFSTPSCAMDVRPGGAFRICIRSAEGKDYWMSGTYRDVVRPDRLVFTHVWEEEPPHETLVTVTFAPHEGGTRLTFRQAVFLTSADRDSHEEGWSECLDHLERHLTGG